ncbi:mCG1036751, partial [Mus musculus]
VVSPGHVLLCCFSSSSSSSMSSPSSIFFLLLSPHLPLHLPFICPIDSSPLFYKLRWEAGFQEIT